MIINYEDKILFFFQNERLFCFKRQNHLKVFHCIVPKPINIQWEKLTPLIIQFNALLPNIPTLINLFNFEYGTCLPNTMFVVIVSKVNK